MCINWTRIREVMSLCPCVKSLTGLEISSYKTSPVSIFERFHISTASVTAIWTPSLPVALSSGVKTVESWNHAHNLADTLEGRRNRPCPYPSSRKTRGFRFFFLSLHYTNSRLENIYIFLFAPLEIISHKNCSWVEKILEGHPPHPTLRPSHVMHETNHLASFRYYSASCTVLIFGINNVEAFCCALDTVAVGVQVDANAPTKYLQNIKANMPIAR